MKELSKNNIPTPPNDATAPQYNVYKKDNIKARYFALSMLLMLVLLIGGAYYLFQENVSTIFPTPNKKTPLSNLLPGAKTDTITFSKFTSLDEFTSYIAEAPVTNQSMFFMQPQRDAVFEDESLNTAELSAPKSAVPYGAGGAAPERVSETNVQIAGIDEPDIVKTNGTELFASLQNYIIRPMPMLEMRSAPVTDNVPGTMPIPERSLPNTKSIRVYPPAELEQLGTIERQGDLLLYDKTLVVFDQNQTDIIGYDISNPSNPNQSWSIELASNSYIVSARLFEEKVYVVTQTRLNRSRPCPITLIKDTVNIQCENVYHPSENIPIDVTFHALVINPVNGNVTDNISFVGSSGDSIVFMSPNALYVTYTYYEDIINFMYNFFTSSAQDIVSQDVLDRIKKLKDYDISSQSKTNELNLIMQEYFSTLTSDERLRIENEYENRLSSYAKDNMRTLEKTGIVRLGLINFNVLATGSIPGRPLNQFSLDEYNTDLRIATTVGGGRFGFSAESANDVYVLNSDLVIRGRILDLGITERIYSARFIEDKGYLVTFRRIDPFYVLDLSNPDNPVKAGELKIPGYSSYLHPLDENTILGIGEESNQVKLSVFDVSDPKAPSEKDKYILDEYWSDVANTHHAFLLDSEHSVFFLPASRGGYVFGYDLSTGKVNLVKAVADIQARRAIYIDDYMYIIGDNEIVVLNENDWTEINQLDLR